MSIFNRLRVNDDNSATINPIDIFNKLPKEENINDLFYSQSSILTAWFKKRTQKDSVIKLHTGGGKTLVGLLIAKSTSEELKKPVLYLVPTTQLVEQTMEKAKLYKIRAVKYTKNVPLNSDFLNCNAVMIATYNALFNGKSKFGIKGKPDIVDLGAVILDDAHAAFSTIRDSFTINIVKNKNTELYNEIVDEFKVPFQQLGKQNLFEDIINDLDNTVLEVPYRHWINKVEYFSKKLSDYSKDYIFQWPLMRDELKYSHCIISKNEITITPILPIIEMFPTFTDADRRVYMSATIADDSEIIKTFGAELDSVNKPFLSDSMAGISERMILIPSFIKKFDYSLEDIKEILLKISNELNKGTVILCPSEKHALEWQDFDIKVGNKDNVTDLVEELQLKNHFGPVVFANRYDGIDLGGDSCRLLVMDGLPEGTSNYELLKASLLHKGKLLNKILSQRIEQGMGRGARGASDYCVIIILGNKLTHWFAQKSNFSYLTDATRAQVEIGNEISSEIKNKEEFLDTINACLSRSDEWRNYHQQSLDKKINNSSKSNTYESAFSERKAFDLWRNGHGNKAIEKIERLCNDSNDLNEQEIGWLKQFAARIAYDNNLQEKTEQLQQDAFSNNRDLLRPENQIMNIPSLGLPSEQSEGIMKRFNEYHFKQAIIEEIDGITSLFTSNTSANKFEEAVKQLGQFLGFSADRYDKNGEGPDVVWLLPDNKALIIEAKHRKQKETPFNKEELGQLLVADKWFSKNYSDYEGVAVSIHPSNKATKNAHAESVYVLTLDKLNLLASDIKVFYRQLSEEIDEKKLPTTCSQLLEASKFNENNFVENYLDKFESN
ncbi:DEAD/DEAH box helicase family protein [Lentisphaerota bacterium WC36G]|nr:DEAD/DEAH box helicase family protein [Lentisphaerae bacterium WC36]